MIGLPESSCDRAILDLRFEILDDGIAPRYESGGFVPWMLAVKI
ncbi:MAG: hypothetical protein U7126_09090 [Microcoleus sp.]